MTWPRARVASLRCMLLLAACLALPRLSAAGDPAALGPWAALELKGGRVLHNARVLSDEGDSIVVRCDEGLVKVAKDSLPPAVADAMPAKPAPAAAHPGPDMVMKPFNPDSIEPDPAPENKGRPARKPAEEAKTDADPVYKGCTIVSFRVKPYQNSLGCAEVDIRNDGESPVVIVPGNIVCVTAAGARLRGRFFIVDGFPPFAKRREVVPAHGNVDMQVTFSNEALDVASVLWAR